MKRYAIVGVAAAVVLSSCGRARPSQQETLPSTAAPSVDRSMTIVGCLVPGPETTQTGEARASGTPPPPAFTLVDATIPAPGAAAPSAVSGTSGTGAGPSIDSSTPRSYSLEADKDRLDDLQRFANSRVEVSGSIVAAGDTRRVRVKDVRQLESKCAAPKKQ